MNKPATVGELKAAGYGIRSVKSEIRDNLIAKIKAGQDPFPGIIGYGDTVIPQIENAVLAGQDIILLGERGQAKTRLMRSLVHLLDDEIPVLDGCEINDQPFAPICKRCRERLSELGDQTPIAWLPRSRRYNEKLATPDVAIADLIGEVDPIKIAEGRYLSDERAIHFGLIPRTNRGIFGLNELPDLSEKIQVGLFNILEERDVQIRGFAVRLPLDIYLIASANPEDYTNRGRIVSPLKDRFGSQIRTHYPASHRCELQIVSQERYRFPEEDKIFVPDFIGQILVEITRQARKHPQIDQTSGVSVRVTIGNMENVIANALRRLLRTTDRMAVPRMTDLDYIDASTCGKVEIDAFGSESKEGLIRELVGRAVAAVFGRFFADYDFSAFLQNFKNDRSVVISDRIAGRDYRRQIDSLEGFAEIGRRLGASNAETLAAALEFVLEGLHQSGRLARERGDDGQLVTFTGT